MSDRKLCGTERSLRYMKRKQGIQKERNRRLSYGKEASSVRYTELCLLVLSDGKDPVLDGKDHVFYKKDLC